MKKLIYLLVLCLCASGITAASLHWKRPARAEDAAVSSQAEGEKSEEKKDEDKKPEEKKDGEKEEKKEEEKKEEDKKEEEKQEEDKKEDKKEEEPKSEEPKPEAPKTGDEKPDEGPKEEKPGEVGEPEKPGDGNEDGEKEQGEQPGPEAPQEGEKPEEQTPGDGEQPGEPQEGDQPGEGESEPPSGEGDPEQPAEPEATEAPGEGEGEAPADELPEDAEAWFERDGVKLGGTLKQTVELLEGGEKVYLRAKKPLLLRDAPLKLLSDVKFAPDKGVFEGDYKVFISPDDPSDVEKPEIVEPSKLKDLGDKADLYFWVDDADSRKDDEDPDIEQSDDERPELKVRAKHYVEGAWGRKPPSFTLSGIPEGCSWSYAAIIYDERFVPMSDNTYFTEEEGVYSLRFAMLDQIGDIVSLSDTYYLALDWTPPEEVSIYNDDTVSYTMHITATDLGSGVEAISIDGGKTWHPLANDETYTYKGKSEKTFPEGSIRVRDAAGNVFKSEYDFKLYKVEEEGGGGGGGGSDEKKKPVLSHASGDGEEGVEYDTLELEVPDEPMKRLVVGGEAMALTLKLRSAEGAADQVGKNQPFTATLCHWNGSGAPDTLLLEADLAHDLGDRFTYEWRFNGEVYRTLGNSGVKYIALKVGDDVAAFPTEGFTGGTKYTELKMLGVSTRRFDYTLSMKVNLDPSYVSTMSDYDFSRDCDLSIHTEVEDMDYELSSSPNSIMYFYNVCLGPEDMLDHPFGEYRG